MEIDVKDYIDDEHIQEIVEEELRYALRRAFNDYEDIANFLSRISYATSIQLVCEEFKLSREQFEAAISKRVKDVLDNPDAIRFEVFRRKDNTFRNSDSPAVKYLDEVLADSKPKIEAAVNSIIENYPFRELYDEIGDTIYECIMRKLKED